MAHGFLTINTRIMSNNWYALNKLSAAHVETAAVVKADAYSLGVAQIVRQLKRVGSRTFFVAQAEEGIEVRKALANDCRIFVLGGHMKEDAEILAEHFLIPVLNSKKQFERHMRDLPTHPFGLQINTGMNRLGMDRDEFNEILLTALQSGPELIMSHLACADDPKHPMNKQQLDTFKEMTDSLTVPRSLAATGGILLGPEYHFDMVRPGIGLYGCFPYNSKGSAIRIIVPVIQVRTVEAGEAIGYGAEYIAEKSLKVATVSVGYADGLFRRFGEKGYLIGGDTKCPIVGRVSMDLVTVDISELNYEPEVMAVIANKATVDDFAELSGTIGHEVLTSFGRRYKKIYENL